MWNDTVLIVDLDHTLVKTNTTYEFIRLLCPLKYSVISKLFIPISILNKILKRDLYKLLMIKLCIKDRSADDLERYARVYYKTITRNSEIYNDIVLRFLRSREYRVKAIVTGSLDFIANNFKEMGFNMVVGSKSHYRNERFHSFSDLYMRKSTVIQVFSKFFDKIIVLDDDPEPLFYSIEKAIVLKIPR